MFDASQLSESIDLSSVAKSLTPTKSTGGKQFAVCVANDSRKTGDGSAGCVIEMNG